VGRLLSNPMINVDDILVRWAPYVVGARNAIACKISARMLANRPHHTLAA
jgi:hypothetical protein